VRIAVFFLLAMVVFPALGQPSLAIPPDSAVLAAIRASNQFATDLYGQLAKENRGKNLFFSPYSMSSAMAMTAEGARDETAGQMGKVLCFPAAAQHLGDDARLIPWNMATIRTGMAALNERFNTRKPVAKEVLDKIEVLRKDLKAADEAANSGNDWGKRNVAAEKSQIIVDKLNKLLAQVDQYELRVANALWGEKTFTFQQPYMDTIHKFYGTGGLFPVDFRYNAEEARQQINTWVEEQTRNRIEDLVQKGDVDNSTRLVLTNAVYFKGQWAETFQADQTKDEDFLLAGGANTRVPMMHKGKLGAAGYAAFKGDGTDFKTPRQIQGDEKQDLLYPDPRGFTLLEMPYKGEQLSMVVIVPQSADGLADLEKKLSNTNLQTWIGHLQRREVNVLMPKFKLETNYRMKDTLTAMGIVRAFVDPRDFTNGAQFDRMSVSQDPAQKFYIKQVIHKAFVEVSEKGTEAAASSAVHMLPPGEVLSWLPFTPTFRADKPFLFLIRDKQTGTILFLGRVTNPKM